MKNILLKIILFILFITIAQCGVTQQNDELKITGNWGDDINAYTIKLGANDIKSHCTINELKDSMTCKLPADSTSGKLLITDVSSSAKITNADILLTPVLASISPKVLKTIATQITITGLFFKSNSTGEATRATIAIGDANIDQVVSSPSSIVFYSPDSFQSPSNIYVSIQGKKSNSLKFTYETPEITSISLGNKDKLLTIIGKNFGSSQSAKLVSVELVNAANTTFDKLSVNSVNETTIIAIVPMSSSSGQVKVNANGQLSKGMNLTLTSVITDVSSPNFNGGELKVTGLYLDEIYLEKTNVTTGVVDTVKLNDCTALTSSDTGYDENSFSKVCKSFPARKGNESVVFTIFSRSSVNGVDIDSNKFDKAHYERPIISLVEPNGFYLGESLNFTFTGTNFANNNATSITIAKKDCIINSISSDTIVCYFESGTTTTSFTNPITYIVKVDGQSSSELPSTEESTVYFYSFCPGQTVNHNTTNTCNSNGSCNKVLGTCRCIATFEGTDCSVKKYPNSSNKVTLAYSLLYLIIFSSILLVTLF